MKNKNNWMVCFLVCLVILVACAVFYNWSILDMKDQLNASEALNQRTHDELKSTQEELASVAQNLELETVKTGILTTELDIATKELDVANETILDLKSIEYELVYMGEFKLTHYCCEKRNHICGTGNGVTATGTQVTAGRTVAVDPKTIPYGSQVYVEGYGWRTAEDCGSAVKNKQIDIAVETHSDALSMGVTSGGVWLLVKKGS